MRFFVRFVSGISDRSTDWLAIISYCLHNIWFAAAIPTNTGVFNQHISEHGISPLWFMVFLTGGLIYSACLFLHWKMRILGTIPLAVTALVTIIIYALHAPMRSLFGVATLYFNLVGLPIALIVVNGRLSDALKRSYRLQQTINELENRFARKQD